MPRLQALLFAVIGVGLLLGVSFFISMRSPWLIALTAVAALLWIGAGFGFKAKARRKAEQSGATRS